MPEPLVSVIIATYNRADTIGSAVESVLEQTYPHIELTVVDDGSTDDTSDRLSRYSDKIQIVRQSNSGPSAARNRGAELAGGDIIAFLDSDDVWMPGKIEKQVEVLEKAGEDVPCCLCNAFMESPGGKRTTSFINAPLEISLEQGLFVNATEVLVTRFVLFNQTSAIRRWAWKQVGGFDEKLTYMEDHDLALRLSLLGPWVFISEPLVSYRMGSDGALSTLAKEDEIKLQEDMINLYFRFIPAVRAGDKTTLAHIRSNLRRAHCRLRMARANGQGGPSIWSSLFVLGWETLKLKIKRRTPWFPRVKQLALDMQSKENTIACRG